MADIRRVASCVLLLCSCHSESSPPAADGDAAPPFDAGDAAPPLDAGRRDVAGLGRFELVPDALRECLPRLLTVESNGRASCALLMVLPEGATCDASGGLFPADAAFIDRLRQFSVDPGSSVVCEATQLWGPDLSNADCIDAKKPGWCLVARVDAGICTQAIHWSPTFSVVPGSRVYVGCWTV